MPVLVPDSFAKRMQEFQRTATGPHRICAALCHAVRSWLCDKFFTATRIAEWVGVEDADWLGCSHSVGEKGEPMQLPSPTRAPRTTTDSTQLAQGTLPTKLAVLSPSLPPAPTGQATALYRLLRDAPSEDYCLLSEEDHNSYTAPLGMPDIPLCLAARYYHLTEWYLTKPSRFGTWRTRALINTGLQVVQRTRNIARILKRERCGAIVAASGSLLNLPAAYLASRWLRIPFYAYLFDHYSLQWPGYLHRAFARIMEPAILRGAAGVIVPNEFLRDDYRRRYRIEPIIVRNPCEVPECDGKMASPWPAREDAISIVYTGSVYHAHYDAFRRLITAIEMLGRPDVKLHLYTAQTESVLEQEGICGPVVYHGHLSPSQVADVQRRADILFLPLAFHSPIPEVIRTSAPGKMGEYLASGRPILVHAPANSFISWYFKEHACGIVADQADEKSVAQAILSILEDATSRQQLVEHARTRASKDFSVEAAQTMFFKRLQPSARG